MQLHESDVPYIVPRLVHCLTGDLGGLLAVPLEVEVKLGRTWGAMRSWQALPLAPP